MPMMVSYAPSPDKNGSAPNLKTNSQVKHARDLRERDSTPPKLDLILVHA